MHRHRICNKLVVQLASSSCVAKFKHAGALLMQQSQPGCEFSPCSLQAARIAAKVAATAHSLKSWSTGHDSVLHISNVLETIQRILGTARCLVYCVSAFYPHQGDDRIKGHDYSNKYHRFRKSCHFLTPLDQADDSWEEILYSVSTLGRTRSDIIIQVWPVTRSIIIQAWPMTRSIIIQVWPTTRSIIIQDLVWPMERPVKVVF